MSKNDTPAPDPRLVEAQIRSLRFQESAVDRMMANSEAMLPLQQEQMQFGLDSSRQAFEQAQADRQYAVERRDRLSGIQNQLIDDARSFNTQDRQNQLAGEAIGDVNQAFGSAREQQARGLSRMGVNPNDGRFAAAASQMSLQQALAQSSAANKVRQAARLEGYALTDRGVNALAGYPSMGMQATGAGASFGAGGLALANQGLAGINSGFAGANGVASGIGQNAGSMYATQAGNYSAAQQQNTNTRNEAIGTGLALAAMFASDKNVKEDVREFSDEDALKALKRIPVSRWKYKEGVSDEGEHIGPMAQDVQRTLGNRAAPDGKMIDPVSMNGVTMAAVAALGRKVEALSRRRGTN